MSEEKGIKEYYSVDRKLCLNRFQTSSTTEESLLWDPGSNESQQVSSKTYKNQQPSDREHSVVSDSCRSFKALSSERVTSKSQRRNVLSTWEKYRDQPINSPASASGCHSSQVQSSRVLHQFPSTRVLKLGSSSSCVRIIEMTTSKGKTVRQRESDISTSDSRDKVDDVTICGELIERRHSRGHDSVTSEPTTPLTVSSMLRQYICSVQNAHSETHILDRSARMIKAASIGDELRDTSNLKQNVRRRIASMENSINIDDVQHSTPKAKHSIKRLRTASMNHIKDNPVSKPTRNSESIIKAASIGYESLIRSDVPFGRRMMRAVSMTIFKRRTVSRENSTQSDDVLSSTPTSTKDTSSSSIKLNPVSSMDSGSMVKAASVDDELYFTSKLKQLSRRPITLREHNSNSMKLNKFTKAVSMDGELSSGPKFQKNIMRPTSSMENPSNYLKLKTINTAPRESNIASVKEEDPVHETSSSNARNREIRRAWTNLQKHRSTSKSEPEEDILDYSPKLTRGPMLLNGRPVDDFKVLFETNIFKIPSIYGRIKVMFQFFNDTNDFLVTVLKSSNVAPLQTGALGVYTEVCLTPGKLQSKKGKCKHNTRNPTFYEPFAFKISLSELLNKDMRIRLYNKPGFFSLSDPIGECRVPLYHYDLTAVSVIWQNLNKCKGQMDDFDKFDFSILERHQTKQPTGNRHLLCGLGRTKTER